MGILDVCTNRLGYKIHTGLGKIITIYKWLIKRVNIILIVGERTVQQQYSIRVPNSTNRYPLTSTIELYFTQIGYAF